MDNVRRAIASLIVGKEYISLWATRVLPTWAYYCERHGLDLVVHLKPLDSSERAKNRKLNWQKCLILQSDKVKTYDQVLWLDADVVVNSRNAPSVFDGCPVEKIGGVGYTSLPTQSHLMASSSQLKVDELERSFSQSALRELVKLPSGEHLTILDAISRIDEMYRQKGISFDVGGSINTGVMVLSPIHHSQFLENIYSTYEDIYAPLSDQFAIPVEGYRQNIIHDIDSRFNVQVNSEIASKWPFLMFTGREYLELLFLCLQSIFSTCFFLHFAAAQQRLEFFVPLMYDWKDFARLGASIFPSILLKKGNFDPAAATSSYFGTHSSLSAVTAVDPNLTDDIFARAFQHKVRVFDTDILLSGKLIGFYDIELIRSLSKKYRWMNGRAARILYESPEGIKKAEFVKFNAEVSYFNDGRPLSYDLILSTTLFSNGYPYIERETYSQASEPYDTLSTNFLYSGYCWVFPGENYIELVCPNWTAYSIGLNDDPRTLSVALFAVRLSLFRVSEL